jgi:hypothetical protein
MSSPSRAQPTADAATDCQCAIASVDVTTGAGKQISAEIAGDRPPLHRLEHAPDRARVSAGPCHRRAAAIAESGKQDA